MCEDKYNTDVETQEWEYTIEEVAEAALGNAIFLLPHWIDGKFDGDDFIALSPYRSNDENPGSLKLNAETGQWSNSATGDRGGDLVSYYAYIEKLQEEYEDPLEEAAFQISLELEEISENLRWLLSECEHRYGSHT